MLSRVSENKMRLVRFVLASAWLVLIASLFYDPYSIILTEADNLSSPFRIHLEKKVLVQNIELQQSSYELGARFFWTMLIPLAPISIMLLGHEAWRRICPLSFFSQIPRYINKNYLRKNLNRKTGKIETKLNLVLKDSWLQRNHDYLQFWLLSLCLCIRILFVNSDRVALAFFLLGLIGTAIVIGYLYGGKTWCNYFCPVAGVQKIYSEPGGVLESKAHIEKLPISQSMCRETTLTGERSTCVGCTSSCPDIDLESSYWRNIENPSHQFIYYGFLGLVIGFYGYYYLYSGSWDYYFSGAWTHEQDQLANLFKPGLYLFDQPIAFIPKLIAVPLVIGLSIMMSYYIGICVENIYRFYRQKINKPLHNKDLLNHMFSFYAFFTINVFYVFGGWPNVKIMPVETQEFIRLLIIIISSLWLDKALSRSYKGYQRESIVNRLLEQLKKLKVNFDEILEGSSLNDLTYDEIYILGKTLPGITRDKKLTVYKNILHDSLQNGNCTSSDSLALLSDMRNGMGITVEEHNITLQELGIESSNLFDPEIALSQERILRENNYRDSLIFLIEEAYEKNVKVSEYLQQKDKKLAHFKCIYNIDEATHEAILSKLLGDNSQYIDKANVAIDNLLTLTAQLYTILQQKNTDANMQGYLDIVYNAISLRRQLYINYLLGLIEILGSAQEAMIMAHNLQLLLGDDIYIADEQDWQQRLDANIYNILTGNSIIEIDFLNTGSALETPIALQKHSYSDVVLRAPDIKNLLISQVDMDDVLRSTYALLALSLIDDLEARNLAAVFKEKLEVKHWMAKEAFQNILGLNIEAEEHQLEEYTKENLKLSIHLPVGDNKIVSFLKPIISLGRDTTNDVLLNGFDLKPFQGCIKKLENNSVFLELLDKPENLFINGMPQNKMSVKLEQSDVIQFGTTDSFVINWYDAQLPEANLIHYPSFQKLLWLRNINMFKFLDLYTLADIVRNAEIYVYKKGNYICKQGGYSKGAYILHTGTAEVIYTKNNTTEIVNNLVENDVIGELSVIKGGAHSASVRVSSDEAIVMLIDRGLLGKMIDTNPLVAKSLLVRIASYIRD